MAPWISYGGSDTGTLDWFRHLDRARFAPYLVTTQPSDNERIAEVYPFAEEVWVLPEFLAGQHMPSFVFDLIHTRGLELVHIMNSRLGFDLIADMAALPSPPAVVVQLHVEEPDRSGYVRYVTTRYGNLVDAFSVSSEHLARVLDEDYNTSRSKLFVIPTGVDAEQTFNPARVRPVEAVRQAGFNILFPGRLVDQKDPMLMVDVVRRIADLRDDVHVYVVGDGPMKPDVIAAVHDRGLGENVTFHPSSRELVRWYAACDLLLMTSVFEGVPYVVYEAMAMGTPVVAPALPGNCELMGDSAGLLVDPRDDVAAYAEAICRVIDDRTLLERLGHEARQRVRQDFTLQGMARAHEALYDDVVSTAHARASSELRDRDKQTFIPTIWDGERSAVASGAPAQPSQPPRLADRPTVGQPLVSVIVPCYNHGRYLPGCLDSILSQEYPELEVIVIDDASTDRSTLTVLAEIESREGVTVLRQPQNAGPSVARNCGIAMAQGRYILPVDSDNLLMPGAIASMVEQLQSAGEQVGFIYPNCQYFGTRDDYFQPPSYNLYLLMCGNYCDTCSLIDRAVFDGGIRYAEDIVLGHEDWDFALTLAARGIRGEPARKPTLRYRKEGFTRSDTVEYRRHSFHEEIPKRHPELYGAGDPAVHYGRYWPPAVDIKAIWAPALSVVLSTRHDLGAGNGRAMLERLERQTCRDFEVVLECETLPTPVPRTRLRRLPPGLCRHTTARLQEGLALARGTYLLVAGDDFVEMVAEPGFVERVLRTMLVRPALEAIAFTDASQHSSVPYRLLAPEHVREPAHSLLFERSALRRLPIRLKLDGDVEVESIARALSVGGIALQWRHARRPVGASPGSPPEGPDEDGAWLELPHARREQDPHRACEREKLEEAVPAIPALPWNAIRRWLGLDSWIPPETELLTRHREIGGERRIVRQGAKSPRGYELEFHLGAIQRFSPPGTARLVRSDGDVRTVPRGSARSEEEEELGHLEQAPLPLLNPIERAVMPDGSVTLISTERDPLRTSAVEVQWLGFIEGYPNEPVRPQDARFPTHGRAHLIREIDRDRRRHFYRAPGPGDDVDEQTAVGELGALHLTAEPGSIPVWIDRDGRVHTDRYRPNAVKPELGELVRWVGAPAGWRGLGRASGRARAVLRRGSQAAAIGLAARGGRAAAASNGAGSQAAAAIGGPPVERKLVGHLYPESGPHRHELFAAVHPVTGDQLLTLHPLEAADMGYGPVVALGHVLADLPLTGTLAMRRVAVPWASRFGLEVRRG